MNPMQLDICIMAACLLSTDSVNRSASGDCPYANFNHKLNEISDDNIFQRELRSFLGG
jgi:hypothetical protein